MDLDQVIPNDVKITILFRDKVRVFYNTVAEARSDGYYDFNEADFPKSNTCLYGYTGLRGDAKDLYS